MSMFRLLQLNNSSLASSLNSMNCFYPILQLSFFLSFESGWSCTDRLFTVGALDNFDHNPNSTIAVKSFHETGINIFQFPSANPGENRPQLKISLSGSKLHQLFTLQDRPGPQLLFIVQILMQL